MFAACLPQPVHQLQGGALATAIRDALVASSFRSHMGQAVDLPAKRKTAFCSDRQQTTRRKPGGLGSQTDTRVRIKIGRQLGVWLAGRAKREAKAVPVMTGEELVEAALVELEAMKQKAEEEWEIAKLLPWPWRESEQTGRPLVAWMDVHQHFAEVRPRSHLEAWTRIRALAGLPAPANPVNEVIGVPELVAMALAVPGSLGRKMRRMMRGPASRL